MMKPLMILSDSAEPETYVSARLLWSRKYLIIIYIEEIHKVYSRDSHTYFLFSFFRYII